MVATRVTDHDWLAEQIRLRAGIWNIDDQHVLATLWWYSASAVLLNPSLASLALTGHSLSPRLEDLVLHHTPSSRFRGSHSTAVLDGGIDHLAAELRASLATAIGAVAAFTKGRPAPLWAIATDAIAGRLLWAGQATGRVEHATALAAGLVARIGPPLPRPRYADVEVGHNRSHRLVHRASCCLLYRVPSETMCTDCPRRAAVDRALGLSTAAPPLRHGERGP
ncbi:hypothetical protein BL253_21540 [Pseudofrankia asymbiotica]|uniref:Ferric siderophore reductase C-terminal domain-containing protein n=1 Tax=Pseudofrankia asymbiotica TaxID=1834516 RepID=A0A1V2I7J6_9ACTN|nr:hypothetical protein BL253_21540 [Pseudofrankia asymbiotica]